MVKNEQQKVNALTIAMEEMGRGWVKKLMKRTGYKRTYLFNAVKQQKAEAPIWDAVEELKKEHQTFLKSNKQKIKKLFKTEATV